MTRPATASVFPTGKSGLEQDRAGRDRQEQAAHEQPADADEPAQEVAQVSLRERGPPGPGEPHLPPGSGQARRGRIGSRARGRVGRAQGGTGLDPPPVYAKYSSQGLAQCTPRMPHSGTQSRRDRLSAARIPPCADGAGCGVAPWVTAIA